MNARLANLAERKALLHARAELDRTRLTFAVAEVRAVVRPAPNPARMATLRPAAAVAVGLLAPVLGPARVARWLRFVSFALTAYRIARNWNRVR